MQLRLSPKLWLVLTVFSADLRAQDAALAPTPEATPAPAATAPSDTDPIPEIVALGEGETVPVEVYKKYPLKRIAVALVTRLNKTREASISASDAAKKDPIAGNRIHMAFAERYLENIKTDCFKNQHQTGSSGGMNNPEKRRTLESNMIGVKMDSSDDPTVKPLMNQVLPKYAYLDRKPADARESAEIGRQTSYGNVVAVLKDSVKARTTWTPGDSLNIDVDPKDVRSFCYAGDRVCLAQDSGANYFEAQVWGPVCVEDVEKFMVNCPGLPQVSAATLASLKATGLPVFGCKGESLTGESDEGYSPTSDQWVEGDPIH